MGPKSKKNRQVKNDFWFFMQDQKKILSREGRGYVDNDELAQICQGRWKHVDERDRARYKEKAKQWKQEEAKNLENKFDAQGRSLADLQREQEAQQRAHKKMLDTIDDILRKARNNKRLTDQSFFLIHFNTLVKTDETPPQYLPCEYAVIEFSLKQGIKNHIQGFMCLSNPPVAYTADIREKAEKSHRLDPLEEPLATLKKKDTGQQYSWILRKIKAFINPGMNSDYPPLFTLEDEVEGVASIMEDLFLQSGEKEGRGKMQIYVIHELFYRICLNTPEGDMYSDPILLKDKVEAELYLYTADMACNYHEEKVDEPKYCSLMIVKRWAYIICDNACQFYGVKLIAGKHVPVDADIPGNEHGRAANKPRQMRYDPTEPMNQFGVVKSRSMAAGVCLNNKTDWTRVSGRSEHAFGNDRQLLEQLQYCAAPPLPPVQQQEEYQDYYHGDDGKLHLVSELPGTERRPSTDAGNGWRPITDNRSSGEWRPNLPKNEEWRPNPPKNEEWRPNPPKNEEWRPNPPKNEEWRPMLPGSNEQRPAQPSSNAANEWRPMPPSSNENNEWRPNQPSSNGNNEWRPNLPASNGSNEWRPAPPPSNSGSSWRPKADNFASPAGPNQPSWVPQQPSQGRETTPDFENSSEFPSLGGFPALGAPAGRGRGKSNPGGRGRGRGRGNVTKQMKNLHF